jgi:hypothetical protein
MERENNNIILSEEEYSELEVFKHKAEVFEKEAFKAKLNFDKIEEQNTLLTAELENLKNKVSTKKDRQLSITTDFIVSTLILWFVIFFIIAGGFNVKLKLLILGISIIVLSAFYMLYVVLKKRKNSKGEKNIERRVDLSKSYK